MFRVHEGVKKGDRFISGAAASPSLVSCPAVRLTFALCSSRKARLGRSGCRSAFRSCGSRRVVPMTEPTYTCFFCGRVEIVRPDGRGFPPDIAKRRLIKACKANGCPCDPIYRAGVWLR